jgi:hypothetical protein
VNRLEIYLGSKIDRTWLLIDLGSQGRKKSRLTPRFLEWILLREFYFIFFYYITF